MNTQIEISEKIKYPKIIWWIFSMEHIGFLGGAYFFANKITHDYVFNPYLKIFVWIMSIGLGIFCLFPSFKTQKKVKMYKIFLGFLRLKYKRNVKPLIYKLFRLKDKSNKIEELLKDYNVGKIVKDDDFNYVITNDNKYITFLEVSLDNVTDMLTADEKGEYIKSFFTLLIMIGENSRYDNISIPLYFGEKYDFYNELMKKNKKEDIQKAIKKDIEILKEKEDILKYMKTGTIMLVENSYKELKNTLQTLYLLPLDFNLNVIDDDMFDDILKRNLYSNIENIEYEDYVYNPITEKYISVLNVARFEKQQEMLFLKGLYNIQDEIPSNLNVSVTVSMGVKKLPRAQAITEVREALKEIGSRHNFDKSTEGAYQQAEAYTLLDELMKQMRADSNLTTTHITPQIKVEGDNLSDIKEAEKIIIEKLKMQMAIYQNPFSMKTELINMSGFTLKYPNYIEISLSNLAYSFPYNFVVFNDSKGFPFNLSENQILFINLFQKSSLKSASSCLIVGKTGYGKSTQLKVFIKDYAISGYRIFSIDQDEEIQGITTETGGQNIVFKNEKNPINALNILKIEEDMERSFEEIISHQTSVIKHFISILINIDDDLLDVFEDVLLEMYVKKDYQEFIMEDVLDFVDEKIATGKYTITTKDEIVKEVDYNEIEIDEYMKLSRKIKRIIKKYPLLNSKTNISMKKRNICFSIAKIKNEKELFDAYMFYIFNFIQIKSRSNQLKTFNSDYEKAKKGYDYKINIHILKELIDKNLVEKSNKKYLEKEILTPLDLENKLEELEDTKDFNLSKITNKEIDLLREEKEEILEKIQKSHLIKEATRLEVSLKDIDVSIIKNSELEEYIMENRIPILQFIDESQRLFRNKYSLTNINDNVREGRKYEFGTIFSCQNFTDIFKGNLSTEMNEMLKHIFDQLTYKIILRQDKSVIEELKKTINLSENQINTIINADKGQGIIQVESKTYNYNNEVNPYWLKIFKGGK